MIKVIIKWLDKAWNCYFLQDHDDKKKTFIFKYKTVFRYTCKRCNRSYDWRMTHDKNY